MPGFDADNLTRLVGQTAAVGAAWIFGSRANGTARADSDLDLAIRARDGRTLAARDVLDIMGRIAVATGVDVQVVDLAQAPLALRMQVWLHGRALFDTEPGRTRRDQAADMLQWFDEAPLRQLAADAMDHRLRSAQAAGAAGGNLRG